MGATALFGYPSPWRQHEASFRRREFYDFELDLLLFRRIGCVFSCVTLIDKGDLDRFADLGLYPNGPHGKIKFSL
jgi:hypothetical protein